VAQVAVSSQINTKHINTVWAECTILVLNLLVRRVTSRLLKFKEQVRIGVTLSLQPMPTNCSYLPVIYNNLNFQYSAITGCFVPF